MSSTDNQLDPAKCNGKLSRKNPRNPGGLCTQAAGWGTDHPGIGKCKLHGGSTPNGRKSAQVAQAKRDVVTFGLPIETDPHTALLDELHRTAGAVHWLAERVGALKERDVIWGKTKHKTGGEDRGSTNEAKTHLWVTLYREERKHLVEVAAACARAGIEERRVRLAEEQGRALAGVIQRIVAGLFEGLVEAVGTEEALKVLLERVWPQLVREVVPRELRLLGSAEPAEVSA